jgi:hypothetical protein
VHDTLILKIEEYAPEALIVMRLLSREENEAQVLEGAPLSRCPVL